VQVGGGTREDAPRADRAMVLVVEDDRDVRHLVRTDLERADMKVVEADSVARAVAELRAIDFDVIILDLTLPDGSGLEVLRQVRAAGGTAHVIILSGAAAQADRILGLEAGADDYVVKPFFAEELTARVRAVGRRRDTGQEAMLRIGALEIDLVAKRVRVAGRDIELTAREFLLLAYLAERPGQVFSRAELLRAVWRSAPDWQAASTVTEHIHRLRTKLELDPAQPRLLQTVRGSGYRLDHPPVEAAPGHPVPADEEIGVVITIDGRIVASDAVIQAMVGIAGPDLLDRSVLDVVAPQSQAAARARVRSRAAGGAPRSQVVVIVGADGVDVPVEIRSETTIWEGRTAVRSELRRATDESLRLRHLVTGVVSDVPDAIIITDIEQHIRSWNLAAERLYGWPEAEVLGRHLQDAVVWVDGDDPLDAAEARLLATGRWHGNCRQRTRDGSIVSIQASTKLLVSEDGASKGIVSVNRLAPRPEAATAEPSAEDVADLARGLERGEFEVHYQPIVDMATRRTTSFEALARWNHPDRGTLAPGAFMATAERSGLILPLGAFVLDAACRQTAAWRRDGVEVNIAVNLSAQELVEPTLVDRLTATAEDAGLDLRCLWLEITETSFVEDVVEAALRLEQLVLHGVGISIDDFGTGWASLTYLRQFPVHVLKIDRSFISGIDRDAHCVAIARSILSLGAELDLVVVAEGVETEEEHRVLQELGCRVAQGYLYGRPTAASGVDLAATTRPLG